MDLTFQNAQIGDCDEILDLYKNVIDSTFTTWDKNYPTKSLILEDIKNTNLYVLKASSEIVAVSFLGKNEDEDEDWNINLKNPLGIARICVSSKYQGKGIGSYLVRLLIQEPKNKGADGMHFHVCTKNFAAMTMYEKVGFKNYGLGKSNYGFDYYKYEQKFD